MTPPQPSVWIQELTWEEIRDYLTRDDVGLLPIGSTEQHGPAGTLGVDTYVAIGLAEDAAKRAGVLVAPPLWYGESSHHMALPGTISVRADTLRAVVKDVCRSLARHGFRKLVLINGHKGSNFPALISAAKSLHEEELSEMLIADPLHLGRAIARDVKEAHEHHGGELELSQVWYRFPEHIRPERFTTEGADLGRALGPFGVADLFGAQGDTIEIPWSSVDQAVMAPNGSLSDSSRSSKEGPALPRAHGRQSRPLHRVAPRTAWANRPDTGHGTGEGIIMKPIYLDYLATTPLDAHVLDAMEPFLREHFGNPSSTHVYGQAAHEAVACARSQVATLLGAKPSEIVFTSGATEATNHALKGVVLPALIPRRGVPPRVVTSTVEHPATAETCAFLERLGCRVTRVPVDRYGVIDPEALERTLGEPTALVTVMHANNEVGTLEPIRTIAALAHARGALVHTDAAQSVGKIRVNVDELGVDMLSLTGHKLYAPKGVGALYVREGVILEPLIHGAGHEGGRRAGTENVPYIVALGEACDIARRALPMTTGHLRELRDRLWDRLRSELGELVALNGHPEQRLPNTLNVNLVGWIGSELLAAVPEIAASTGSACHEGQVHLSPVLQAMGVPPELARGAVRLSVGRFTTEAEVERAAELLVTKALEAATR
jgi:cysteine desulfurase